MGHFKDYFEFAIKLIDNNWGATIIGWLLGWITAVWSNRQLARQQAATIKSLNDSIAAFGDRVKEHLEPLTPDEENILEGTRNQLTNEDVAPNPIGLYFRALGKNVVGVAIICLLLVALRYTVGEFFLFLLPFALVILVPVAFLAAYDAIPRESIEVQHSRLLRLQDTLSPKINSKLADHLKLWANRHQFLFFEKGNVLRMIEAALAK